MLILRAPGRSRLPLLLAATALVWGSAAQAQAQEHDHGPAGEEVGEVEELIVQATRSGRRVQDEPIRVEIINQEEIEEKVLMSPGNIAMMVAETGGVRVQVTSPALGAASIRMQGMRGRYTQLLADGLPLYGGQALGVLQIPPSDLGQVEVIKGAASALYGPSALGGVINLVSRRPDADPMAEILLNATSRNGQDATVYAASPITGGWSGSITGGKHRQLRQDLDDDGWIDTPAYDRWTVRPRLFWEGDGGGRAYFTIGGMREDRQGGTAPGRTTPTGEAFPQTQTSRRLDAGFTSETPIEGWGVLQLRAAGVTQKHGHRYGDTVEDDRHRTLFAEAALAANTDATSWLVGAAVQNDAYRSKAYPTFDYSFETPALFAQVEHRLNDDLTVAGSVRWDSHSDYGSHVSPRVSVLYRPGPWTVRASVGQGFYAPTPFVEEIEAAGLSRLASLGRLKAETADTVSLEGGYAAGPFEANLTLFGSRIENAVRLEPIDPGGVAEGVRLVNLQGPTETIGVEALVRYRWNDVTVTGSYVYVDATEPGPGGAGRRDIPVTPRHTAGVVAMWEQHDKGRLGIEAYYTGAQDLEDNPYRSRGRPYLELGMLGEIVLGDVRLFLNLENLLNVRQTKYDRLVLPRRGPAGEWTTDAWAPADGFVVNGGVRIRFGGGDH
ncbi:TonB-dependent receptor plug domain-containing protein [Caulobacter mirabilis]|uniref:TonB-dependent receptor n=1 Tax=Caulobacter mirabilis TaxID=69666 RepID=A0A2D2B0M9_9CAUL|nr:TonB-dependent receptor [Caulobacter mirabilis]ATQ43815.1 TonB-dependent receptor [Caulobacter mirabilis]